MEKKITFFKEDANKQERQMMPAGILCIWITRHFS